MNNPDQPGSIPPKLPSILADEAEARRLGLTLSAYQHLKSQSPTGNAAEALQAMTAAATRPVEMDDIAAEERDYRRLQHESGIFKRRGEAPGLLKTAFRAPGEVARTILFFAAYLGQFILLAIWLNHIGRRELGPLWLIVLGILAVTSFLISGVLWRSLGERGRNVVRWLIRFWPVTVPLLLFLLGLLKIILS